MSDIDIKQRVKALRQWMEEERYDAFIVMTADPHNNEYLPERWKNREWLTGFTGSAGTAVVIADGRAALWTDSRYYLQAEEQLDGTPFTLMREGEPGVCSPAEWVADCLPDGGQVGIQAEVTSIADFRALHEALPDDCRLSATASDPFRAVRDDLPDLPAGAIVRMDEGVAEVTAGEKMKFIYRHAFPSDDERSGAVLLNDLAEIAWTLNLRGEDVEYNPVFVSYLMIERRYATLFTAEERISAEVKAYLSDIGVHLKRYKGWRNALADLPAGTAVALPDSANMEEMKVCEDNGLNCLVTPWERIQTARAVKTRGEQEGFRRAMLRDGAAMVAFLRRLDEAMEGGVTLTETGVDRLLTDLRTKQPGYQSLSFATIAGYGPHGAIVHYEADSESDATLEPRGLLLLDSGAQYDCGTTDITRTIALGPLTDEERRVYTAVLKAHIGLSRCIFPEGTTGLQLDTAARYPLWQKGYDFGHGTGHGVGSRLCVHEGPQQIRKNLRGCTTVPFRAGMTITDEPGVYVPGHFGVRIENTLLCVPHGTTPFGTFLAFEPLTLCPIDTRPVITEQLDETEREWLNNYHATVRDRLRPLLTDEADRQWLARSTQEI